MRIRVRGGGKTSQIYACRRRRSRSQLVFRFLQPSPRGSSPTTRSTSTRPPRRRSRTSSPGTTAPFSSPTPGAASRRSSVVAAPAPGSRSPTVERSAARACRTDACVVPTCQFDACTRGLIFYHRSYLCGSITRCCFTFNLCCCTFIFGLFKPCVGRLWH
uniref:Uncharacterized protein n=1 Tax=Zea mays TaxID=4577 RepID=B4FI26_MAIZE|nr:unknown [Zea mays]